MTSPFAKRIAGGDYFKPAEHVNDLAIILEPKRVLHNQTHTYEGVTKERSVGFADISCFRNTADLEAGVPSVVMKDVAITNEILVADLERNDWIGAVALVTVEKVKRAYVYRDVSHPGAEEVAATYYEKRNAEVAANLEDAPDDFE